MVFNEPKTILVTGASGFIRSHISSRLLKEGWRVVGLDCMSDYDDTTIKERRESMLLQNSSFRSLHEKVETPDVLAKKNSIPIQAGDVRATWTDTSLLKCLTGYMRSTDLNTSIKHFVAWYRQYYNV